MVIGLRNHLSQNIKRLQTTANIIATLDVLSTLSNVAEDMNYVRPHEDNSGEIDIKEGRHPVIEKMIPSGSF